MSGIADVSPSCDMGCILAEIGHFDEQIVVMVLHRTPNRLMTRMSPATTRPTVLSRRCSSFSAWRNTQYPKANRARYRAMERPRDGQQPDIGPADFMAPIIGQPAQVSPV